MTKPREASALSWQPIYGATLAFRDGQAIKMWSHQPGQIVESRQPERGEDGNSRLRRYRVQDDHSLRKI